MSFMLFAFRDSEVEFSLEELNEQFTKLKTADSGSTAHVLVKAYDQQKKMFKA